MIPAHELQTRFVHEVAARREISLPQLARIDLVVLRDAAVLRDLRAEVSFAVEVAAETIASYVIVGLFTYVRRVNSVWFLFGARNDPLNGAQFAPLVGFTSRKKSCRRQLVARREEQLVLGERSAKVESRTASRPKFGTTVWNAFLRDQRFVLQEAERRTLPLVRAAAALGADDVRSRARVLGVVRVHVDAELLERFLRQRRPVWPRPTMLPLYRLFISTPSM